MLFTLDTVSCLGACGLAPVMVMNDEVHGLPLAETECVGCGQGAAVCPTGAVMPRSEVEAVWRDLDDPRKTVVVQMAPAVRVALDESSVWPRAREPPDASSRPCIVWGSNMFTTRLSPRI